MAKLFPPLPTGMVVSIHETICWHLRADGRVPASDPKHSSIRLQSALICLSWALLLIVGRSFVTIRRTTATSFSSSNGKLPVMVSQQIQPKAQISLAKQGSSPLNSSGAAHRTVQAGPVMVMDSPDVAISASSGSFDGPVVAVGCCFSVVSAL